MASGILALLDDVAMLLDDAAVMSKVAAKKAVGLLGDDLAVNAEKATGFKASRELPVIWAITKGSLLNKVIILPVAFLLSSYLPWLIVPILLLGGAYLSYEGAEKVYEWIAGHENNEPAAKESSNPLEIVQRESRKIKSAIRTDFILSIEIIVISLGTVIAQLLPVQIIVVTGIALLATVGVYGLVAVLVRMDDAGYYLMQRAISMQGYTAKSFRTVGRLLASSLPILIRVLSIVGTVAMLLVGGGIYVHNIDFVHHALAFMPSLLADLAMGLFVGAFLLVALQTGKAALHLIKKVFRK